ncbi:MAG: UDP-N-acetylmuramoyl-L-alanyl-D-glutamate--2,6-diaminopimelate ligase [Candidatus Moranbacteria bacterium]|nr:UDP-N-acetylmuramoyl-L-alanyl-D-glutamate--2,6-diaminopimelate ligase [Candidatus Moranbacteria bacterium]
MNIKRGIQKIKNIYHLWRAIWANVFFGFPSKKIIVIGVTGTNGKTTTVQMIGKMLEDTGKKVAVYSTINFKIGEEEWVNKTKFTTQSAWELQQFIRKATKNDCEYLVLETSSHSLDQFRVWGVGYNIAVMTNITREHLDYHFTMEDYRKIKRKLFEITAKSQSEVEKIGVVNKDTEGFEDFALEQFDKNYLYSFNEKIINIENGNNLILQEVQFENFKSVFKIKGIDFKLNIPGQFNIENALAAVCVGVSQEISLENISSSLEKIENIPGRMDFVKNEKGINAIVDYALTPDSMEKVGQMMKDFKTKKKAKLIWVFGSCGDRDRGKRPIIGEIVSKFADSVIITNEDPYTEDPVRIIKEIERGVKDKNKLLMIVDRKKALEKAFEIAKRGDIVLVTGKGAEENMMIGSKKVPWNDKQVIREILSYNKA